MAMTARADAARTLKKEEKEEKKKLPMPTTGPGKLWLFKRPLDAVIFETSFLRLDF